MDTKERLENLIIDNEELAGVLINALREPVLLFKMTEKTPEQLMILNKEMAAELMITHQELAVQIEENELLVAESLIITEKNDKRIKEIIVANKKISILSAELLTTHQNIEKLTGEINIANIEEAKRAKELISANKEKAKRAVELIIANKEKAKRAAELIIANKEKTKRASELIIANREKAKRNKELIFANKELANQIVINKIKEDSIIESEEKYSSAFNSSPDIMIIINMEGGKITETNDAFTSVSGFTKEEAITSLGINLLVDDHEGDLVLSTIREGKNIAGKELLFKKKNGDIIIGLLSTKIIHINRKPNIIASIHDITESKKTEIELRIAKERAEESDHLKSSFLSNMSHEIRTPLNGIIGFTELLREPNLSPDDQMDFIQIIQKSSERLLITINNIIDISKIESKMMETSIKNTKINEQIEFIYKFFKPEIKGKGLKFSCYSTLAEIDSIIKTDPEKLYGILINLVKNAIKFTNEGSIELGCKKNGDWLEFFVKDTGIGFSPEFKEAIFDRFRQGSDSLTRNYEGSGLGLSISKSYVEMLGGKMWVESEVGKGSIFHFTIPLNPASEDAKTIENVVKKKDEEIAFNSLKVLVAEDDEISNLIIKRVIQNIAKEILHAKTGVEAITFCKNNPDIDLVLMDIGMTEMDGYEATRQIRKFNKDLIIIAQTANAFSGEREKALKAGCNDYITKPIEKTLMNELINKHCKGKCKTNLSVQL
jgi:PAS domain S-box-containing protein